MTDRIDVAFGITLCRATVLALAAAHIQQFSDRIAAKAAGTRLDDCEHYRAIWVSIRTSVNRGNQLGAEELSELYGAVSSRDWDELLSEDELAMLPRRAS